jgi:hypothetical protein
MRIGTYIMLAIAYLVLALAVPVPAEEWKGTVVQPKPLQVRSLQGTVRKFQPPKPPAPEIETRQGDLVLVTYEEGPPGVNTYSAVSDAALDGTVIEISADKSRLVVRAQSDNSTVNVPLQASKEFQPLVTAMLLGDRISATYVREKEINSVRSLEWQSTPRSSEVRCYSFLIAVFGLFVVAFLFTKGHPTSLFLGADNRYSNSKFQSVLWFWVLISAYCAIVFQRVWVCGWSYIGGVSIPQNLLILSGISALTFATAKTITVGKVEQAAAKGEAAKPNAVAPKGGDLINDDLDRTDLGDFQMLVIIILAVVSYGIAAVAFMQRIEFRAVITMPDIDSTLLALFGLSQAAYLGKKAAGEAAGMTSDQAVKAAADAAGAAKNAAANAVTGKQKAQVKEAEAKSAAAEVGKVATKAEAQPELEKTQSAANAAREAAREAESAAKAAEAQAVVAKKLADEWSKEPAATAPTKSSYEGAKASAAEALAASTAANTAAESAEGQAKNASEQASKKP